MWKSLSVADGLLFSCVLYSQEDTPLMEKYRGFRMECFIDAPSSLMPDMFEGKITGSPMEPVFVRVGVSYSM